MDVSQPVTCAEIEELELRSMRYNC